MLADLKSHVDDMVNGVGPGPRRPRRPGGPAAARST